MRPIGFSTGALAYAGFRSGLSMIHDHGIDVVELSALRYPEIRPLVEALDGLDLSTFRYVALHAPSEIRREDEKELVELLLYASRYRRPIVVHPDAIYKPALWRPLGDLLCIENMDKRKPVGRTADELSEAFRDFPQASFCFDIGHARQVDSTMTEAYFILKAFGSRLRQVHLSEVNTRSKHDRLSCASILAFREVAHLIPEQVPVILESPVSEQQIELEIQAAREALPMHQDAMVAL